LPVYLIILILPGQSESTPQKIFWLQGTHTGVCPGIVAMQHSPLWQSSSAIHDPEACELTMATSKTSNDNLMIVICYTDENVLNNSKGGH
jgi:hypothetical protein